MAHRDTDDGGYTKRAGDYQEAFCKGSHRIRTEFLLRPTIPIQAFGLYCSACSALMILRGVRSNNDMRWRRRHYW